MHFFPLFFFVVFLGGEGGGGGGGGFTVCRNREPTRTSTGFNFCPWPKQPSTSLLCDDFIRDIRGARAIISRNITRDWYNHRIMFYSRANWSEQCRWIFDRLSFGDTEDNIGREMRAFRNWFSPYNDRTRLYSSSLCSRLLGKLCRSYTMILWCVNGSF